MSSKGIRLMYSIETDNLGLPWGSRDSHMKSTRSCYLLQVKKVVCVPLRVFNLKMSTVGAFAVSFRQWAGKTWHWGINVYVVKQIVTTCGWKKFQTTLTNRDLAIGTSQGFFSKPKSIYMGLPLREPSIGCWWSFLIIKKKRKPFRKILLL